MEKIDARKHNQQTQYELRKQIARLRKKGLKNGEVAELVGISQSHASTIWLSTLEKAFRPSSQVNVGGNMEHNEP